MFHQEFEVYGGEVILAEQIDNEILELRNFFEDHRSAWVEGKPDIRQFNSAV